jgi:MSHA biogenesis protein MshM
LYEASAGVPRVVNVIAHKALMLAYGKDLHRVGGREMREAARDTLAAKSINRTARWVLLVLATLGAGGRGRRLVVPDCVDRSMPDFD